LDLDLIICTNTDYHLYYENAKQYKLMQLQPFTAGDYNCQIVADLPVMFYPNAVCNTALG